MQTDSINAPSSRSTAYPLSPLQEGMLLHRLQTAEPGVDLVQLEGRLHESIDADAFGLAWGKVAMRHDVLRTRFRWDGLAAPRQEVEAAVATPFETRDLRGLSAERQGTR